MYRCRNLVESGRFSVIDFVFNEAIRKGCECYNICLYFLLENVH